MSKVGIICASGIGDALLMMIGAHYLRLDGNELVFFHDRPALLAPLFPEVTIRPFDDSAIDGFDTIYLQNDNSARAWHFFRNREAFPQLIILFPKPSKQMREGDILFDPTISFVSNMETIFGGRENGLKVEGRPQKRAIIHPTSADMRKCYPRKKFLAIAKELSKLGYEVVFTVSPEERPDWIKCGFEVISFASLLQLAQYLANSCGFIGTDSAVGHLASNVGVRTVTVASNAKQMTMWRPDWSESVVVTTKVPLPNFKGIGLRMREWMWHWFISPKRVLKAFL